MDTGSIFFGAKQEQEQETKLLTLACRFIPYDQWLVTHVDTSWKVDQVKAWLLAKCIANNSPNAAGPAPNTSSSLPPIDPPSKPKTRPSRRPASPIVFAEFASAEGTGPRPGGGEGAAGEGGRNRVRSVSPITFAPSKEDGQSAESRKDESEGDEVFRKHPIESSEKDSEGFGMGYEEDDEWDSEDEMEEDFFGMQPKTGRKAHRNQYLGYFDRYPQTGRPSADQTSAVSLTNNTSIRAASTAPYAASTRTTGVTTVENRKGSYTAYHPALVMLIRFSTGQILEHHYPLSWYEMKPYELVEIHRVGVVMKLPRELSEEYIQPYWEGWVKALRVVFRGEARDTRTSHTHTREGDDAKTPRDGAEDKEGRERERDTSDRGPSSKPKSSTNAQATVEAVWKMSGAYGNPSGAADAIASLPNRSKTTKKKEKKRSIGNDMEMFAAVSAPSVRTVKSSRNSQLEKEMGASRTTNRGNINNGSYARGRTSKLEWRERWVFIKDGVLHLRKECSDSPTTTTQILPLSALAEIRGSEQLGRSGAAAITPGSVHRIVCAKFKAKMTTTRYTEGTVNEGLSVSVSQPQTSVVISAGQFQPQHVHHSHTHTNSNTSTSKTPRFRASSSKPSQSNVSISKEPRSPKSSTAGFTSSHNAGLRVGVNPTQSTSTITSTSSVVHSSSLASSTASPSISGGKVPSFAAASVAAPLGPIVMSSTGSTNTVSMKPKITLNIKPLPSSSTAVDGAPGDVKVIKAKPRTSSLRVLPGGPREKGKGRAKEMPSRSFASSSTPLAPRVVGQSILGEGVSDTERPNETPSETASEVPTEEDGAASDDEAEVDDGEHPAELRTKALSGMRMHSIDNDSDASDSVGLSGSGSGGTLSSPVFAHSEDESDWSDGHVHRSYGYGYGYGGTGGFDRRRRHAAGVDRTAGGDKARRGGDSEATGLGKREDSDADADAGADTSYVVVSGGEGSGRADDTKEKGKARQDAERVDVPSSRRMSSGRRSRTSGSKSEGENEWIVLDLGDDYAFKSFLRVLHRYAPHMVFSSFLSALPTFNFPTPTTPAPTPAFNASFPNPVPPSKSSSTPDATSPVGHWNSAGGKEGDGTASPLERTEESFGVMSDISHVKASSSSSPVSPSSPRQHEPSQNQFSAAGLSSRSEVFGDPSLENGADGTLTPKSPITFASPPVDSQRYRHLAPIPASPQPSAYDISPQVTTTTTTMRSRSLHQPDYPYLLPHHPLSLNIPMTSTWTKDLRHSQSKYEILKSSMQKNAYGTFGALPYPEWRMEVVMRAQRAGLGDLSKAMEAWLCDGNPGFETLLSGKDLGLSLSSGSIIASTLGSVTVQDGKSPGGIESVGSGGGGSGEHVEEDASSRRKKRRRDRKLTLEQENRAMGLDSPSSTNQAGPSTASVASASNRQSIHSYVSSVTDSLYDDKDSFYARDPSAEGNKKTGERPDLKLGYVDMDDSDSGEESSDAEWLGWMADIRRQAKVREREEVIEKHRREAEASLGVPDPGDYWDFRQQDDHRRYQEVQVTLEPSAVVISMSAPQSQPSSSGVSTPQQQVGVGHTSQVSSVSSTVSRSFGPTTSMYASPFTLPQGPGTPIPETAVSVLTSPSSNESLGRPRGRKLSFGLSNVDPPSSATSPALSYIGQMSEDLGKKATGAGPVPGVGERSHSHSGQHRRFPSGSVRSDGTVGPSLMHHASTGLIDFVGGGLGGQVDVQSAREREFQAGRRPSMPAMSFSASTSTNAVASSSAQVQVLGSHSSYSQADAEGSVPTPASDATYTVPTRRASTAGLMNSVSSASLGRSSSVLGKGPGLLRKKEPEAEKSRREKEKEKDKGKGKEKEKDLGKDKGSKGKAKEKEKERENTTGNLTDPTSQLRRPRLSLSMSASGSRQSLKQTQTPSRPQSPTPTSPTFNPKRIVRRVKSGSSLLSGEEGDSRSTVPNPPVKKKKGLVKGVSARAERILMGLESTLDFVDGR